MIHLTNQDWKIKIAESGPGDQERSTPQASAAQPAINARPPNGVMAPSQRCPVRTSKYRLPENTTIPRISNHPESVVVPEGHREAAQATANSPKA